VGLERSKGLPQFVPSTSDVKQFIQAFYDFMRVSVPRYSNPLIEPHSVSSAEHFGIRAYDALHQLIL
jgi:hypothetical protein